MDKPTFAPQFYRCKERSIWTNWFSLLPSTQRAQKEEARLTRFFFSSPFLLHSVETIN